jgi:imidazoleglycerol phosphate synthase glutamine amidotransferase subunit HisH
MSATKDMLEIIQGKVHFYLTVGSVPAIEVILKDKEIVADIKNPLLAIELGVMHLLKGGKGKSGSSLLKQIKGSGYRIKVKYKMLEMEL